MKLKFLGSIVLLGMLAISCSDNKNSTLGPTVGPKDDTISVNAKNYPIGSQSFNPAWIISGDDDAYNMLGEYDDPIFGKTTASFLAQFSIAQPVDFGDSVFVDSVKLRLLFGGWYGDSLSVNQLEVYQVDNANGLNSFDDHRTNENPLDYTSTSPSNLIGSLTYTAANLAIPDSARFSSSYFPTLIVNINKSVGQYFADNQKNGMFSSNDQFKTFFQGIYVKPTLGTKTIMKCQVEKHDASGNAYNSTLIVYYTNEKVLYPSDTLKYTPPVTDSIADTTFYDLDYDGIQDMRLIRTAGSTDWHIELMNSAVGALNSATGHDAYTALPALEFRNETAAGSFDSTFQISNTTNAVDQIYLIKTSSQRWVKNHILFIAADSMKIERTVFSGMQAYGFISARGDAAINFVDNVAPTTPQYDTTTSIAVKGLGMNHTYIYLPSSRELNSDTSTSKPLINRGQIILRPSAAYAHKSNIPTFLTLGMENAGDVIPGTSYTAVIASYVDSTNSYTFNISAYTQFLINNPDSTVAPLVLKVYNEIGDPSGLLLNKPDSAFQVIHTIF